LYILFPWLLPWLVLGLSLASSREAAVVVRQGVLEANINSQPMCFIELTCYYHALSQRSCQLPRPCRSCISFWNGAKVRTAPAKPICHQKRWRENRPQAWCQVPAAGARNHACRNSLLQTLVIGRHGGQALHNAEQGVGWPPGALSDWSTPDPETPVRI